ncbi:MAG: chromosome segregation protein SMC [Gammaproteobacteria bacterium]|nr:chromosome segregation protein SMC [Gammaproteobacteria bacterium]
MRLTKIKLAGFKSFVDPTTVHLPSNLVGVVGPNGCGKSNVIDAIRWVMGETSAKHLRGDSMADVIFNGSSGRKPVGTATIELFFDNSDGSVGGQYANYSEISIKRSVSREGTSQYFLNGTRCRRKDITGIFLGTGLGPRSYAIIEQGMVSRLIEAKPDEMRVYLEEAAGISKYKERRRETENRIRHTRDNLDRLNDLREEVDKHIKHLQRQARQAERFKELKQEERQLEAELLAIRLTALQVELDGRKSELGQADTRLQAAIADQRSVEAGIEQARERHTEAAEAYNEIQSRYYAVQSDISRLEQSLAHSRELRQRQQEDLQQTEGQLTELADEIDKDQAQLADLEARLEQLAPDLEQARSLEESSAANLQRVEDALDAWQTAWHEFNLEAKEHQHTSQVEGTRIEQLEAQLERARGREQELATEGQGISLPEHEEALVAIRRTEQDARRSVEEIAATMQDVDRRITQMREAEQTIGAELEQARGELDSRRGRVETLEALQAAALGQDKKAVRRWLASEGLDKNPRLAQQLVVEQRWQRAVETVLGDFLQAVCVKRPEEHLGELPGADIAIVDAHDDGGDGNGTLAEKVSNAGQAAGLLRRVRIATGLDAALALQRRLGDGESVITADGVWLGQGWVRVCRGSGAAEGLISREQDIRETRTAIRDFEHQVSSLEKERARLRDDLVDCEARRGSASEDLTAANRKLAEAEARLAAQGQEFDRIRGRLQTLERDTQSVRDEIAGLEQAIRDAQARREHAAEATERLTDRRPTLERQQQELLDEYNRAREQADKERANVAAINIEYESRRASKESANTTLARVRTQRQSLEQRIESLRGQIDGGVEPLAATQAELETQLAADVEVEQELAARRKLMEAADHELRAAEARRVDSEKRVGEVREANEGLRIAVREIEVRREGLAEQFDATGRSLDEIDAGLESDATADAWIEQLERVQNRISRLGAINLAAIEEFSEQSERKQYLDSQFEDLTAALETLEGAIRKIDRETRSRFQDTFEKVNGGLQRLFPQLFGGGHAYLSLDSDDLLNAGVTVMARPPGKRNSHIHLLSGGEKALTAVALIFSIFELNPAPFCLLDEVDAPLDDANVGRFCEIVKDMSKTVQFIIITHNKTTMELTRQLTGVTMNEPGVSRLVSVDIDEAVQLVAS